MQPLTPSQLNLISFYKSGVNIYCSGMGGTGKSYMIEVISRMAKSAGRQVVVCAPTGIAALNVDGVTIHRLLGLSCTLPDALPRGNDVLSLADVVIMDEVSMCRQDVFEHFMRMVRAAEKKRSKQVILFGDFGQLPPVLTREERELYYDRHNGLYAFTSSMWGQGRFHHVELKEIVRQTDRGFIEKLRRVRIGDTSVLETFEQNREASPTAITLCCTNREVDLINRRELSKLNDHRKYGMRLSGEVNPNESIADRLLELAPGAKVLFINNDREGRWANGTMGIVVECLDKGVCVMLGNGNVVEVPYTTWPVYGYRKTRDLVSFGARREVAEHIEFCRVGSYSQLPLRLAWAITVHKSQGQTYEEVNIAPGRFFAPGQLYVALSRCKTESGLHITGTLRPSDMHVDPEVMFFLQNGSHNHLPQSA